MKRPQHDATSSRIRSTGHDGRQYYCLTDPDGYLNSVLYQVVPAGKNFFHILEVTSGRVKGFRSDHIQACELARQLEARLHAVHGGIVSSPG
ncbi:hypothetical protein EXW72_25040 [Pseudomonas sp. BCA14]|uniref:hypothetical protein n=1 Tax=unclassified Pseudomonas TaxID=196821 RepID=UPI000F4B2784|nr:MULTISPECIES: hypothetical protein [Pseudomonas]TFF06924.1 hypothetical protein EXW71_21955 [Pseudomonas sp. BCA17]TFF09362.1 hypothetical protein EXW70_09970 [Pseudomonas sp. JMN1]TFF19476.1 hypothetical protein EXW72_25040 [Pseudomonas sp. BCA14]TFF24216.1 hypothetical protein EXW73_17180 [Pseudomonas sp. BCA13]